MEAELKEWRQNRKETRRNEEMDAFTACVPVSDAGACTVRRRRGRVFRYIYTTEEKHGDLTLVFTRHGETADSYIERAAAQTPRYRELRVATSDGLEQSQVLSSGAIRMTSRELLRELREMRKSGMSAHQNQPNMNRNTIFSRMPEDIRARLEKLRRGE